MVYIPNENTTHNNKQCLIVSLVFACPLAVLIWINKLCYRTRVADRRNNDKVNSGRIMEPMINTERWDK